MKNIRKISGYIYVAIEKLETCFGGTEIELISDEMYRSSPTEFIPLGPLGVDIKVNGIKVFLGCESMAEEICTQPSGVGQFIADNFVFNVMKTAYPEMFVMFDIE